MRGTNVNERRVRSLTVAVWLTIDATMDNVARTAIDFNDDLLSASAQALRERGWAASNRHADAGEGSVGWPPRSARLEIELSADELAFIRQHLVEASTVSQRLLDSPQISPQVREEQERSLIVVRQALEAVSILADGQSDAGGRAVQG